MGQGFSHCLCGAAAPARRLHAAAVTSEPFDEGLGHSFCYVRPDQSMTTTISSKVHDAEETTTFRTISGASVSANTATPLSTSLLLNELTWPAAAAFESSISIAAVPLQPVPRLPSGPLDRGFLSGPIERGFMSGPLDPCSGALFSGPLPSGGQLRRSLSHAPRSRRAAANIIRRLTKAITRTVSKDSDRCSSGSGGGKGDRGDGGEFSISEQVESGDGSLHWAQGKAGEDRVHVVISEEHGWVFVGIYDGFNGPDATDYLLSNLYSAVQQELKGLLWEEPNQFDEFDSSNNDFLADSDPDPAPVEWNRKRIRGVAKKWEEKQRQWRSEWERERLEMDRKLKEQLRRPCSGGANHAEVLKALSKALMRTEEAYLETADEMVAENPELALMGSCVLVMLMKGEDVYLLNVGDSRAVLARKAELDVWSSDLERISEEGGDRLSSLVSLQLSRDHSTNIDEEVLRIRKEHRDDPSAIANDRVKGSLKVTRAFGAGFLKQPKWNEALLEMFRIDYVGTSPYITCNPSLYHHKLGPKDRFLILSSDGLYQYLTNEEAVAEVELFIEATPEGDPAQHLVEEVLFRAANKAGMDFHELLEIPQGDRRRYHDDVSIIVISLEGRIWRSCL